MVLCGFWHGLTLSFAAWGLWHGSMLFTEALTGTKPVPPSLPQPLLLVPRRVDKRTRCLRSGFLLPDSAATIRLLKGFTTGARLMATPPS
jgi:hypothetical protein